MAHTAHKDPEAVKEYFDSAEVLEQRANELVALIKQSKHFVVFTGAGISTSAGIPDFRGPQGVWTLQAEGRVRTEPTVSTLKAIPTPSHMSLVKLQNEGILKYVISQNVDGLHRRSGLSPDKLSELHGNSNLERCRNCGKEYLRDFNASASYRYSVHDHRTGRKCDICGSDLYDTIINFGENLPEIPLQRAWENTKQCDLMLVLGSSLTVSPACHMPEKVGKKGKKLVICNLQKTPLDELATIRIFAKCDDLMKLVMKKLGYEIPPFILSRRLLIEQRKHEITLSGIDVDNVPVTFLRAIEHNGQRITKEPFQIKTDKKKSKSEIVRLHFMGHYNEPVLDISLPVHNTDYKIIYKLNYNPMTGIWTIEMPKDLEDKELSILIESLRISETNNDNSSSVSSQSNLSSKK